MNPTASRVAIASSVGSVSMGNLAQSLGLATDIVLAATSLLAALLCFAALAGEVASVVKRRRAKKSEGQP